MGEVRKLERAQHHPEIPPFPNQHPGESMGMGASPGEPRTQRHTTEWEQAEEIKEETTKRPSEFISWGP